MFGYIRPYKPEMKMSEYGFYRSVYCGLCHALGSGYGFFARLLLGYDMTFTALLCVSQAGGCRGFEKKRCPVRPFSGRLCCRGCGDFDFPADCTVMLFYFKLLDDLDDAGAGARVRARLLLAWAKGKYKKACVRDPDLAGKAKEYSEAQRSAEKSGAGPDASAEPTAKMTEYILTRACLCPDKRAAARTGYFLGRWIYFADALEDIEKDTARGSFNPFAAQAREARSASDMEKVKNEIVFAMNLSLSQAAAAYELIDIKQNKRILSNIIYLGLGDVQKKLLRGRKLGQV